MRKIKILRKNALFVEILSKFFVFNLLWFIVKYIFIYNYLEQLLIENQIQKLISFHILNLIITCGIIYFLLRIYNGKIKMIIQVSKVMFTVK